MKILLPIAGTTFAILLTSVAIADSSERKWPGEEREVASPSVPTPQMPQNPVQQIPVPQNPMPSTMPGTPANNTSSNQAGYLGIGIDILPQSVVAQMPPGVSTGEGILVTRFADDSPAKTSGLLPFDILLSYDDTKLIHPKQFIQLVHKDKPGREVKLKVLRNGKVGIHTVTLGMQETPKAPDGLAIKQLGKNDYQANIRFTDANGKQHLRQYRGTREQIYYQALNARDLPPKDREQILYAAGGPNKNKSKSGWSNMMPFGNKNNGNNSWGSFFPFGNKNNRGNNNWGSFFPFNR